uniref:uncharacterized protein LOC122610587 n=1 Tax=Erigeron canadensis TaxID=72917 RepID=UPI001CB990AA|nr:uncharacterized protein LOC122610587 [Erigeron canadensis]
MADVVDDNLRPIVEDIEHDVNVFGTLMSKLDFGDPLYLHASDTTGTPLINLNLKGTGNYKVWSCAMELALETKNKIGFINGTCMRPDDNEILAKQWDRCNYVVLSWILSSVSEEVYMSQIFSKEAATEKNLTEAYLLVIQFQNLKIVLLCQKPLEIGKIWEEERCYGLVGSPGGYGKKHVYQNFIRNSSSNNSNVIESKSSTPASPSTSSSYGAGPSNTHPQPTSTSPFSSEQLNFLMQMLSDKSVSTSVQSHMAGTFFNSNSFFNSNFSRFFCSNSLMQTFSKTLKKWISDSGATQHMTCCDKWLFNVEDVSNLGITVGHPNGTQAKVLKIGNFKLTDNITLFGILYVPEYCVNLFSVHNLARDSRMYISFDENNCYVQDLNTGTLMGTGSEAGGLYIFDAYIKDLWGPYKVQSKEGFRYFLNIVDDFTRAVWVFLLKGKDDTFDNFITFYNLLRNQFQTTIKVVRSDNGSEFTNLRMNQFFKLNGIIHQTSCAYTPQQNGIAERKHRHLLNVSRSLMFQGGIPLNMWPECILTATFLINRLPSSVLSGKSPYEMVFNCKPNLSFLRAFGCLCFATVLNNNDKFSTRSNKCVLIGYSEGKKAYKLFCLDNKSILYSRDVRFYENIFPFKINNKDCVGDDSGTTHLNFFNNNWFDDNNSLSPNDDRRGTSNGDGNAHNGLGSTLRAARSDSGSTHSVARPYDTNATPIEEQNNSEGNLNHETEPSHEPDQAVNLRRSNRVTKQPSHLEDFVLNTKTRHSITNVVNFAKLSYENLCFASNLNKIIEPSSYDEA